jgi:hypothetical protein
MKSSHPNFTIIVNWKKEGFGCTKVCSYCNWRNSPLLPHGAQSKQEISAFIQQCRKSFITISGGADPLYQFEDNLPALLSMIRIIKSHGFKVRIITREIQHVAKLRGIVDFVSISLNADVLEDIARYTQEWKGMDIEYSLVLPPLPTDDLVSLKPQYQALFRRLEQRLVLRENLNSIYPLDFSKLILGHRGIVFVSKDLCLNSRYLSTLDCTGHDIVLDHERLANYLMTEPRLYLFGGFVKHLINPRVHSEFSDIDLIALNSARVMQILEDQFAYAFKAVSPSATSYPRYYLGKSTRAGKPIQLIAMKSATDAIKFVNSAQFDADRVAFCAGEYQFDGTIGEPAIRHAIDTKRVNLVTGPRDLSLFSENRPMVEQRHKVKLLRKGFTINE